MISNICAIVPAAGLGRRMQMKYPKQYISIANKTILEHAVLALLEHPSIARVIIVINPNDIYFSTLDLANNSKIIVVNGGKRRSDSVLSGIKAINNTISWILIHDAVRPCLYKTDITKLLKICETSLTGGILATPVHNTIKRTKPGKNIISHTIRRTDLWHALTPQLFPNILLRRCLTRALNEGIVITDEASALEYYGFYPKLIRGRIDNIKITYQEDLQLAEFYLTRINHKEDR